MIKDISGKKFNRLTAVKWASPGKWLFRCECGTEFITKTVPEWADMYNFKYATLYRRIFWSKWSVEKALETPIMVNQF